MSRSDKSQKNGHPLRKLLSLAVLAGIVVAIKNALEDKGGSYEGPAAAQPSTESVPTPPAPTVETAEQVVEQRPVENLDEFADPIEPGVETGPEPVEEPTGETEPAAAETEAPAKTEAPAEDAPERAAVDEKPLPRKPRNQPPTAGALADAESPEELRTVEDVDVPGKIDPFGIR